MSWLPSRLHANLTVTVIALSGWAVAIILAGLLASSHLSPSHSAPSTVHLPADGGVLGVGPHPLQLDHSGSATQQATVPGAVNGQGSSDSSAGRVTDGDGGAGQGGRMSGSSSSSSSKGKEEWAVHQEMMGGHGRLHVPHGVEAREGRGPHPAHDSKAGDGKRGGEAEPGNWVAQGDKSKGRGNGDVGGEEVPGVHAPADGLSTAGSRQAGWEDGDVTTCNKCMTVVMLTAW
jgi:hypothetical protein